MTSCAGSFDLRRTPRAVFRCDASPRIGGGHVMRCLTLAERLRAEGWWCGFATGPLSGHVVPRLAGEASAVLTLKADEDSEDEAQAIGEWVCGHADLLVADHYHRDIRFERRCRPWAERILVIDDLADRQHDGDVLIDPSGGHSEAAYAGLVPPACQVLSGARHALLRPAFAAQRSAALLRRAHTDGVQRILVGFGATDAGNATGLALRAIAASGLPVAIDIVVGAVFPHADAVRTLAASMPQPARVFVDASTETVARLMVVADLAIGAAGGMAWERCCLGLPSITLELADNQRGIAAVLNLEGPALNLGSAASTDVCGLAAAIRTLALDHRRRRWMAAAAAQMCDGRGLDRLARLLDTGLRQAA